MTHFNFLCCTFFCFVYFWLVSSSDFINFNLVYRWPVELLILSFISLFACCSATRSPMSTALDTLPPELPSLSSTPLLPPFHPRSYSPTLALPPFLSLLTVLLLSPYVQATNVPWCPEPALKTVKYPLKKREKSVRLLQSAMREKLQK